MRPRYLAWLFGLTAAIWQVGCTRPCDSTSQCGDSEMCVASTCQALTCERTIFARNPKSGECMPLSGCFLTEEQRTWLSCDEDPCSGRDESSCLTDQRCQPYYLNPTIEPRGRLPFGPGSSAPDAPSISCAGGSDELPVPPDPGFAPGVNNGTSPKHPTPSRGCGLDNNQAREYGGCRAAPVIEALPACETLRAEACGARRDCMTSPAGDGTVGSPRPVIDLPLDPNTGKGTVFTGECFTRHERPAVDCSSGNKVSCLLNPACQPIGSSCFCPAGGSCSCDGGDFLGCEPNDRLRRCHSSAECGRNERCDNDEACIAPRTFASGTSMSGPSTTPGTSECLGACVPKGCSGMGERMCNERAECDGGKYGTVCHPKPYCVGNGGGINNEDGFAPGGGSCGCDAEFMGCGEQAPQSGLRAERSLLVRDPEIIDDPAFRFDAVMTKLAPAGRVDEFAASLFKQVGASKSLVNGANSTLRNGYAMFLTDIRPDSAGLAGRLAGLVHPTALINRIDLAKTGSCGEARLTYALTKAYTDGNQRMTVIFELRVPDDGNSCRTVAQRWAELSAVDSITERRSRLISLYDELLKPENLGQIRTNEFLNRLGKEPWELREFHLNASGLPELAPAAQTVDKRFLANPTFLQWVRDNTGALTANNAVIPTSYLAAASTEDGGRLKLGASLPEAEKALNAQTCAGCHLTETQSPFVHIGERLGKRSPNGGFLPVGRAVIDTFLQKELVTRAQNLQQILNGSVRFLLPMSGATTGRARVH